MTDIIPRAKADAWVAAAYEAAAQSLVSWLFYDKDYVSEQADTIRALTPDDARAALEAMLAEAEKRGMLRAAQHVEKLAKAYDTTVDDFRKARRLREADEMAQAVTALSQAAAAIRAEAEE
jgi:DNA-binding ferritin-like protein